jgi:hypothetical protein
VEPEPKKQVAPAIQPSNQQSKPIEEEKKQ